MRPASLYTASLKYVDPAEKAKQESILRAIAYFDIFHYPLRIEEIGQFLNQRLDEMQLHAALQSLLEMKLVYLHHGFYMLHDNPLLVHRRKQGNQRAVKLLRKAMFIGRFLHNFPFVRAVGISGSLSKNYADQKADIDFFIITRANRLWIARTFMHLFKKLTFLTGRQHYYCMNYYIDETALELQHKNLFNAIELKTLIPVTGQALIQQFHEENAWASQMLPCIPVKPANSEVSASWIKKLIEGIFNNRLGDKIDSYLLNTTTRRWKRKEETGIRNKKGLPMGLITGKHFARSNPGDFQERVMEEYMLKLQELGIIR
jgi:hypothetical protein